MAEGLETPVIKGLLVCASDKSLELDGLVLRTIDCARSCSLLVNRSLQGLIEGRYERFFRHPFVFGAVDSGNLFAALGKFYGHN